MVHGSSLFVCGNTYGALDGNTHAGGSDIFLTRWTLAGDKEWTQQLGNAQTDAGRWLAADKAGNLYVFGDTTSTAGLHGNTHIGLDDCHVTKFNNSGSIVWVRQIGTPEQDLCSGGTVDLDGSVYLAGGTRGSLALTDGISNAGIFDAILAKFSGVGIQQFVRQFGGAGDDRARGAAVDSLGNIFIAGGTGSSLGGLNAGAEDIFLTKFGI